MQPAVVDSVPHVLTLQAAQINPAPEFATTLNMQYISLLVTRMHPSPF
jgi:chemotaxis signal transduction protein